VENTLTSNKKA